MSTESPRPHRLPDARDTGVPTATPRPAPARRRLRPRLLALLLPGLMALGATTLRAEGPSAAAVDRIDEATIAAILARVPPPTLPESERVPVERSDAASAPAAPAAGDQREAIDGFERGDWPAGASGSTRWLAETLMDLNRPGGGYHWASSACRASEGARALCPTCGGPQGTGRACGEAYPEQTAASILLRLDLSNRGNLERLDLVMDIWADAAPDEGLLVNYIRYDQNGVPQERRTIYSATGRPRAWAPGQRINLLAARDRVDPSWQRSLSGQIVYLEFLFLSHPGSPPGEGIYVDALALESRLATVPVTPVPTPSQVNRRIYCPDLGVCGTLQVETYVDYRCDSRYQAGVDRRLGGLWIDLRAGSDVLGALTSRGGSAFFRLPVDNAVTVTFTPPPGHRMCDNSPNPATLDPADFGRYKRKKLSFRVTPQR